MSGSANVLRRSDSYDDDMDVNAFFLPGGILDPDSNGLMEGKREESTALPPDINSQEKQRIATQLIHGKNHWSSPFSSRLLGTETKPFGARYDRDGTMERFSSQKQQSGNSSSILCPEATMLMPPPGFETERIVQLTPRIDSRHSALNGGDEPAEVVSGNKRSCILVTRTCSNDESNNFLVAVGDEAAKPYKGSVQNAEASDAPRTTFPSSSQTDATSPPTPTKTSSCKPKPRVPEIGTTIPKSSNERLNGASKSNRIRLPNKVEHSKNETKNQACPSTKQTSKENAATCLPKSNATFSFPAQELTGVLRVWIVGPVLQLSLLSLELYDAVLRPALNQSVLLSRSATRFLALYVRVILAIAFQIGKLTLSEANIIRIYRACRSSRLIPEGNESTSSTVVYFVFYALPPLCRKLIHQFQCPPFVPHIISNASIYSISYPAFGFNARSTKPTSRRSRNHQNHDYDEQLDYRLCRRLLQILRYCIPITCLVEGLSSPNARIMILEGSTRLGIAYFWGVTKHGFVSSPFAWFCGALQLLLVAYVPTGYVRDAMVATAGFAAIKILRIIRRD